MWGIVLGVVGIGIALYEIATRPSTSAAPVNPGAAVSPGAARAPVSPASRAALQKRAAECGLLAGDVRDAERWVRKYFGSSIDLFAGLTLMQSTVHISQWPMSARRVHCTYMGGAVPPPYVPPPSVDSQVRDALGNPLFPRYGG